MVLVNACQLMLLYRNTTWGEECDICDPLLRVESDTCCIKWKVMVTIVVMVLSKCQCILIYIASLILQQVVVRCKSMISLLETSHNKCIYQTYMVCISYQDSCIFYITFENASLNKDKIINTTVENCRYCLPKSSIKCKNGDIIKIAYAT